MSRLLSIPILAVAMICILLGVNAGNRKAEVINSQRRYAQHTIHVRQASAPSLKEGEMQRKEAVRR
jgi:hypothetical protein